MVTEKDYKVLPSRRSRKDSDYQFFRNADQHPFRLQSQRFEPVNAWWLAELSLLSYWGDMSIDPKLRAAGLEPARKFGLKQNHALQLMVTGNGGNIFVVFRGTSAGALADVITDLDLLPGSTETGYVHCGFARALRRGDCWDEAKAHLDTLRDGRKIWFTGHSLGAAMATIASQQFHEESGRELQLYTFGSPRVVGLTFRHQFGPFPSFRVVNDRDVVPHLPPPPLYWHVPELIHVGPHNHLVRRNTRTALAGAAALLTFGLADFRHCKEDRYEKAAQLLVPEHPGFCRAMLKPVLHHDPKEYATKMWNHYVWTELNPNAPHC